MIVNYAHRGASFIYPENTMLAFEKAISMGCTGIETDVQRTKDGELVLIHDEYVNRTTDGVGLVCDYSYKELTKLDAGSFRDKKFKNLRIPTLKEFLSYVGKSDITINLEIKNSIIPYKYIEKDILLEIFNSNIKNNIIISSFNHESVIRVKKLSPQMEVGALCGGCIKDLSKYVKEKFSYIHPNFSMINKEDVNNCKCRNLGVNVYTVDDEKEMKRLIDLNVNGIITNCPDKLKKVMESKIK
ncbi:MAG: glycerophosphodiester phosphodiesterase family protein [Clostridium sp.]